MDGLGELLKGLRLNAKISIEEISSKTNIPEKIIIALEKNDNSKIPGKFYFKNFIKYYLIALDIEPKDFFKKYASHFNGLDFDVNDSKDYLYKMKYSRFERRNNVLFVLILFVILLLGYVFVFKHFTEIKRFFTLEKTNTVKELPQTRLDVDERIGLIYFGFDVIDDDVLSEQFDFCFDRYPVELILIINKKTWVTVFQNGKKIIGRDYKQGETIELKGYSFFLHIQHSSAIDVLLNGKALNYFKGKKGYQKLMVTPQIIEDIK